MVDHPPGVVGEAVAHREGGVVQAVQVGRHAPVDGIVVEQGEQQVLGLARRLRRGRVGGQQADPAQGRDQAAKLAPGEGAGVIGQPQHRGAQQAGAVLGALGVAPEPEQVVGDATGQVDAAAVELDRGADRAQQADVLDRAVTEHPGVLAAAPALHRHHRLAGVGGDARQPARHHRVGVGGGDREGAQRHRARLQAAAAPHRRAREAHLLLRQVGIGAGGDACAQLGALRDVEAPSEARLTPPRAEGGLDHQALEVVERARQAVGCAAPPALHRGQDELLAEDVAAQPGQQRHQRGVLRQAAAEGVDDGDVAAARGLDQAGDPEGGFVAQLERIAEVVVEPAQDDVDRVQAAEGLEEHAVVAHREVATLDQGVAEVAREVGMLEVALVVGPGSEQHDARIVVVARRQADEGVAGGGEEGGQSPHPAFAVGLRQDAREHDAVLERVAGAGGRLRAVGEHPPRAVGSAHQVGGVEVQAPPAGHGELMARAQEAGMGEQHRRRQQAVVQQALRPVAVGEDEVEEVGALRQPGGDAVPLGAADDLGQGVELPRAIEAARIAIDVVGHPVLADQALRVLAPPRELVRAAQALKLTGEGAPLRAQPPAAVEQLVPAAGRLVVVGGDQGGGRALAGVVNDHRCGHPNFRRSRVKG